MKRGVPASENCRQDWSVYWTGEPLVKGIVKCNYGQQAVHIWDNKCQSSIKMVGIDAKWGVFRNKCIREEAGTAARACLQDFWPSDTILLDFNTDFKYGIEIVLSLKLRKLRTIWVPHPPSWKRHLWIDLVLRCFKWCLALHKMKTGRDICLIRSDSIQRGLWSRNELWMVKKLKFQEKYLSINEKWPQDVQGTSYRQWRG